MTLIQQINNRSYSLSQSRLKKLLGNMHPRNFFTESKNTPDTDFGKVVEAMILNDPENYIISDREFTPAVIKVGDRLINNFSQYSDDNIILAAHDFDNRKKPKDKIKALTQKGLKDYYDLKTSEQIVLSKNKFTLAKSLKVTALTHPLTKEIFNGNYEKNKRIDFDYLGEKCKGFIDLCTDRVIDIKVTSLPSTMAAYKFRWDIQGAFYHQGTNFNKLPMFIVFKTYAPDIPDIYIMSEQDLHIGKFGLIKEIETSVGRIERKIEGFYDLIHKYKYYRRYGWDTHLNHKEGYSNLNLFT